MSYREQFKAAEEAYREVEALGTSCGAHLHSWLTHEITFQNVVGTPLFIQPRARPAEPYYDQLWWDIATALRTARITRFKAVALVTG